jgi:hypothetical protein
MQPNEPSASVPLSRSAAVESSRTVDQSPPRPLTDLLRREAEKLLQGEAPRPDK